MRARLLIQSRVEIDCLKKEKQSWFLFDCASRPKVTLLIIGVCCEELHRLFSSRSYPLQRFNRLAVH